MEATQSPPAQAPEDPILSALKPRTLAPQLAAGGLAPFLVYQLAHHNGMADAPSLALATVVPAMWVIGNFAWRRRVEVIPGIALFGIVIGLVAVVAFHGNELALKMRESLISGALGLTFLVSLVVSERPFMYHMGKALASSGGDGAQADFETLWGEDRARRVVHVLTLLWGSALFGEAVLRAILALTVPTGTFLAVAPVIGWVVIGSMMWFTVGYIRRSRQQADLVAVAGSGAEPVA